VNGATRDSLDLCDDLHTEQVEENKNTPQDAKFIFLSSKDADLRNLEQTRACFQKVCMLPCTQR
jgi:hypothetical protein